MVKKNKNRVGIIEAVKQIGVSVERLRYWEQQGIVKPKYVQHGTRKFRRFSQDDINRAISVKMLVDDEKYTLQGAIKKFEER